MNAYDFVDENGKPVEPPLGKLMWDCQVAFMSGKSLSLGNVQAIGQTEQAAIMLAHNLIRCHFGLRFQSEKIRILNTQTGIFRMHNYERNLYGYAHHLIRIGRGIVDLAYEAKTPTEERVLTKYADDLIRAIALAVPIKIARCAMESVAVYEGYKQGLS